MRDVDRFRYAWWASSHFEELTYHRERARALAYRSRVRLTHILRMHKEIDDGGEGHEAGTTDSHGLWTGSSSQQRTRGTSGCETVELVALASCLHGARSASLSPYHRHRRLKQCRRGGTFSMRHSDPENKRPTTAKDLDMETPWRQADLYCCMTCCLVGALTSTSIDDVVPRNTPKNKPMAPPAPNESTDLKAQFSMRSNGGAGPAMVRGANWPVRPRSTASTSSGTRTLTCCFTSSVDVIGSSTMTMMMAVMTTVIWCWLFVSEYRSMDDDRLIMWCWCEWLALLFLMIDISLLYLSINLPINPPTTEWTRGWYHDCSLFVISRCIIMILIDRERERERERRLCSVCCAASRCASARLDPV